MKKLIKKVLAGTAAAVVLAAAGWWGVYDVNFDPRQPENFEAARNFIRGPVNEASVRPIWRAGDTVTLCYQVTACAIWAYNLYGSWALARSTSSRTQPTEYWLRRIWRWIYGDAGAYDPEYSRYVSGGGGTSTLTPQGYWTSYNITMWGATVTGWDFIITGWTVTQSVNRSKL